MTKEQKKRLVRSRARRRNTLTPCKSNQEAIQMNEKIKQAIPKEKQQEYISALLDATVITCDICEKRILCDKRYEDCQYNPANEVD